MPLPEKLCDEIHEKVDLLLNGVRESVNDLTLREILNTKNPLLRLMFSENPREYLFLFIMQLAGRSIVTRFGNLIEEIFKELITLQGGEILGQKRDWKPYDLKFRLPDGNEYWIEIKSIVEQNNSAWNTINRLRNRANDAGKKFLLCIYYSTGKSPPSDLADVTLIGKKLWQFIGGDETIQDDIFQILNRSGKDFSLRELINNHVEKLYNELENAHP
jgi:hypothetical protein